MKNQVIKVLNEEHGKKVIQYWKNRGVDTGNYQGTVTEDSLNELIYYGVIKDNFSNYSLGHVSRDNAEIIELPIEYTLPQVGERILVWDDNENKKKERLFLAYIPQAVYSVICVADHHEERFRVGVGVSISSFKNWSPIPKEEIVELTMEDISNGKGVGIKPELIRIKK